MSEAILEIEDLCVEFRTRAGPVRVLDGVTFAVEQGRTTAVVGESGCGKSMTALSVMGLLPKPAGRISGGRIRFAHRDLVPAPEEEMRKIRGRDISMVFQEPMTSLNPVFTVGDQLLETILHHESIDRKQALERVVEALRTVRIPSPTERIRHYPHQLSGGLRQRVMIAMAIICNPKLILADEPTTALDVTVQAEIFELLMELRAQRNLSMVLITHDMSSVAAMADSVIVMYAGRVVERGPTAEVLGRPLHPYTQALIGCIPDPDDEAARTRVLKEIPGIVPNLRDIGAGCSFADRCSFAFDRCRSERPPFVAVDAGRGSACWLIAQDTAR